MSNGAAAGQQQPLPQTQQQQAAIAQHDISSGRPITFYDVSGKPAGTTSAGGTFYSVGANENLLFRTAQEAQAYASGQGKTGQQVGVSNVPSSDYWRQQEAQQAYRKAQFGVHDVRQPISAKILSEMGYLDTTIEKRVPQFIEQRPGEIGQVRIGEIVQLPGKKLVGTPTGTEIYTTIPETTAPKFYDRSTEINRQLGLGVLNAPKGKPIDVSGFPVIAIKPARPYIEPTKYTTQPLMDITKDISKMGEEYANKLFAPTGSMFTPLGAAKESARITTKAITSLPEFGATIPYGYEMIARDIYGGKGKEVPGKIITGAGLMALGLGTSIKEKPIETLGTLAVQSVMLGAGIKAPKTPKMSVEGLTPIRVIPELKKLITTPLKPEAPKGYVIPGLPKEMLTVKEAIQAERIKAFEKAFQPTTTRPTTELPGATGLKTLLTKTEALQEIKTTAFETAFKPQILGKTTEAPAKAIPENLKGLMTKQERLGYLGKEISKRELSAQDQAIVEATKGKYFDIGKTRELPSTSVPEYLKGLMTQAERREFLRRELVKSGLKTEKEALASAVKTEYFDINKIKSGKIVYTKEVPSYGYVPEGLKQLRYMPRAKTGMAKFIASEEAVSYIPTFERAKPIISVKRQVLVAEREPKIMGELYTKSEIETLTKTVTGAKVKPFIIALPITRTKTKKETATQTLNKLFTIPKIETSTRTAVLPKTKTKTKTKTEIAVTPFTSSMTSVMPITTPEIATEPITRAAIRNITKTVTLTETITPERTKLAMPYFEQVPIGKKKGRKSRYSRFLKLYSIGKPENILGSLGMKQPKRKIKSKPNHRKKRKM